MWRNLFALAIIIIFWTPFRALADISCAPTQPLQQQNRTHMKHRTPAGTNPGVALTTVENMVAASPAAGVTVAGFRRADRPIDQRELQVVSLKGDLWQFNIEPNDCDFHLEISGVGKTANEDRVIVEIPQGPAFVRARNALLQQLQAASITLRARTHLTRPIRIQVLGYVFYDAWHFSSNNPQRGHGHGSAQVGSLWEIHPVRAIIFPQS